MQGESEFMLNFRSKRMRQRKAGIPLKWVWIEPCPGILN